MRRNVTGVFLITAALTGVAAALMAIQLLMAELPLAAAAVLLFAAVAGVHTYKQQATIRILHDVRRQVAHLSVRQAAPAPAPAAPSNPSPPPNPTDKFRRVTPWTPPKVSYSEKQGRVAAGVAADPDAPYRLFAATNGLGAPDFTNVSVRSIAFVGSDELAARLAEHHTVQRLHPRFTLAELEHAKPTALVIEEQGLDEGPWAGALDADGPALLSELRAAQAWLRRNSGFNYVLPSRSGTAVAAPALRADTVLIEPEGLSGLGGPATLVSTLVTYVGGAAK